MARENRAKAPSRRFERIDVILFGLLAVTIARIWLMALPSSLWVDELVTLFVIRNPGHPSFAVAPQVEGSLYFWLPRISLRLLGTSEVALRLPSALAMGVALYFIARLAARLIHPEAGWFAVFACLALNGFDFFAVDARPYALGIAIASMSLFFLVRWFDDARWVDELAFILLAALLWRVHLFYWPFYVVFALYGLVRLASGDANHTKVGAWQVVFALGVLAASLTPVAWTALAMRDNAHSHVFRAPPTLVQLLNITQWIAVAICGGVAWIVKLAFRWEKTEWPVSGSSLTLILLWWLLSPVCLFAYSRLSGNGVLILRYVSLMLPGLALAGAAATARFLPAQHWKQAAAVMALVALLVAADWTNLWPWHEAEGWRQAARLESQMATDATPVLCPSGLIEALPPVWTPDYHLPGFLYAHLSYYPLRGRPLVFPFAESLQSDRYAAQVLHSQLIPAGKFIVYGPLSGADYLYRWLTQQPELAAWHTQIRQFGLVFVITYSLAPLSDF